MGDRAARTAPRDAGSRPTLDIGPLDGDLAVVLGPRPVAPADGRCRTLDGSTWVYRDGAHLTVAGADRLVPLLTAALAATG